MCPQPRRRPPPASLLQLLEDGTVAEPPNALAVPLAQHLRRGRPPPPAQLRAWLQAGFALDGRDADGATALICAAAAGDLEAVALLVGQGARVNATDARGYTALARAALAGHAAVARYLKSRGASPHAAAPLFDAIRRGDAAQVATLLQQGTGPHLRDRAGRTPLQCAAAHRHAAVVRVLRAHAGVRAPTDGGPLQAWARRLRGLLQRR